MLNREIISASIPFLDPSDTVTHVLERMDDLRVEHLALVSGDKYLGLVSEDSMLNVEDADLTLSQLENNFSPIAVQGGAHFMESVQKATEFNLSIIPVIDKTDEYLGSISAMELLKHLGKFTGVSDPGGLIVLEMDKVNFSFSDVNKIVETNDAQITQLNTTTDSDSGIFYVTLKLNKFEIADIIATFQRYDYHVKYYFGEELFQNELRDNYDHLMNYLSI